MHDSATGNTHEHEHIRLGLWDYADALRATDSLQTRLALMLYAQKRAGKP